MPWRLETGGYLREILTARVYDVAVETPLQVATSLSEKLGNTVLLKREDLQPVKSFKLRGAYNKMTQLSPEELARGVICSSAGNHAQGVALSAARLGCSAVICMPLATPDIKVAAVRALGGTVDLVGESYQEAQARAQERSAAEGRVFIAPYDDPYTIAGQGTIASEILRQADMDSLDAIFVAIGGGGLVAGIAAFIKALKPGIKIIGVEPIGANAMAQSLARGERVTLTKVDAFADGVAVKYVGAETFRLCRELLDGVVLVDNSAISAAIKDVFNETRSILEPAGAVAVAGAKAYLTRAGLKGQTVIAVTSGANMNFDRLRLVSELADVGAAESMLAVEIPESPGAFVDFVETAVGGTDINVTEFKYRYSENSKAHILFSLDVPPGSDPCIGVVERLAERGFPTVDISGLETAQVHLRHLVGGRARATEPLADERIFQVDFPERPGALRRFLPAVSPRWNVTLFHYRRTGNRSSGVLLGVQVPPDETSAFSEALAGLEGEYVFTEVSGRAREVFKMFLQ
jgi:threonine dehydratase